MYVFAVLQPLHAQKWVNPNFDAQRLDYRDLGYPEANEIQADNSPVTALLTHSNGRIYGATSGIQSYLFMYDRMINKVRPLGMISGTQGVYHSLVEDANGMVYIGTGLNFLREIDLTQDFPGGQRAIEEQLWKDVKTQYENYRGGVIYRYSPEASDGQAYLDADTCQLESLGIPVAGNSIYAMTIDTAAAKIYGISYPDAHFFLVDLKSGTSVDKGEILSRRVFSGPERTWRSIPRSLIVDGEGKVYFSGDDGLIEYYDPQTDKFAKTMLRIPGEYWEVWNYYGYPVVESFVYGTDGKIYGGTNDGFIFKLDLGAGKITNLGKPRLSRRVRAMTCGYDGRLYMICGQFQEPCKLFSYNMLDLDEGFWDMGVLGVDRSPYYAKRPYQFDSMTTGLDGTVFIGESERRAKLFLFMPGQSLFEGNLNPSNPR